MPLAHAFEATAIVSRLRTLALESLEDTATHEDILRAINDSYVTYDPKRALDILLQVLPTCSTSDAITCAQRLRANKTTVANLTNASEQRDAIARIICQSYATPSPYVLYTRLVKLLER